MEQQQNCVIDLNAWHLSGSKYDALGNRAVVKRFTIVNFMGSDDNVKDKKMMALSQKR